MIDPIRRLPVTSRPLLASASALAALLVGLAGCGTTDPKTAPEESARTGDDSPMPMDAGNRDEDDEPALPAGFHDEDGEVVFRTEQYVLEPGTERFLCYAATVDQDLVIDKYSHQGAPTLHHLVFARTLAPEPDGMTECDVLFRTTWEPMYLAGAGASTLQFPEGTAHQIAKGTQMLSQLHLLNAQSEAVSGALEVRMHRSTAASPKAVNVYIFGNFDVQIPPLQKSTVESTCTVADPIDLVAVFPHMHRLGKELTFDVGPSADSMQRVYQRSPYDFDDQRLEMKALTLGPGDVTHIACNYDNPFDRQITFGESTTDEMCFLIGFAVRPTLGGCFHGTPPIF